MTEGRVGDDDLAGFGTRLNIAERQLERLCGEHGARLDELMRGQERNTMDIDRMETSVDKKFAETFAEMRKLMRESVTNSVKVMGLVGGALILISWALSHVNFGG